MQKRRSGSEKNWSERNQKRKRQIGDVAELGNELGELLKLAGGFSTRSPPFFRRDRGRRNEYPISRTPGILALRRGRNLYRLGSVVDVVNVTEPPRCPDRMQARTTARLWISTRVIYIFVNVAEGLSAETRAKFLGPVLHNGRKIRNESRSSLECFERNVFRSIRRASRRETEPRSEI